MAFIPGGDRLPAGQRVDQRYNPPPKGSLAAGGRAVIRARQVIVSGTGEGVFVYNGTPAAGNLISTVVSAAGTDPYGNAYLQGTSEYEQVSATVWRGVNIQGPVITFITATTHEGPWSTDGFVQDGTPFNTPVAVAVSQLTMQTGLAVPSPGGGGTLYVASDGSLHYVGPGGTDTKIANS